MNKTLVFDMDGTLADLYSVPAWLEKLRNEDSSPYEEAMPLCDMDSLNAILSIFKAIGYKIVVTTWLSKESSREYDAKVRTAKKHWLEMYKFPVDEIHIVKYGTTKANCTRKYGGFQVLIDDNEKVRKGWTLGGTIDANINILEELIDLLSKEVAF